MKRPMLGEFQNKRSENKNITTYLLAFYINEIIIINLFTIMLASLH